MPRMRAGKTVLKALGINSDLVRPIIHIIFMKLNHN